MAKDTGYSRRNKSKPAPVLPPKPPSPFPVPDHIGHDYALKTPLGVDYSAWEPGMVIANMIPRPQFIYCRASLGKAYVDPVMRYYEMQAKMWDIPFSPYHFYQQDHLQEQLDNFLRATVGMEWSDKEPPMLDCEYQAAWPFGIRGKQLADQYKFLLDGMERETGVVPWIYTNQNFWGKTFYDPSGKSIKGAEVAPWWTKKYPVIVAWYPYQPDDFATIPSTVIPSGFKIIKGWQYAENGRSAGYTTIANDLNQMYL